MALQNKLARKGTETLDAANARDTNNTGLCHMQ